MKDILLVAQSLMMEITIKRLLYLPVYKYLILVASCSFGVLTG